MIPFAKPVPCLLYAVVYVLRSVSVKKVCVRGIKHEAVGIGRLERYVADWKMKNGSLEIKKAEPNGHKVAILGAGPAGLTCAGDLCAKRI